MQSVAGLGPQLPQEWGVDLHAESGSPAKRMFLISSLQRPRQCPKPAASPPAHLFLLRPPIRHAQGPLGLPFEAAVPTGFSETSGPLLRHATGHGWAGERLEKDSRKHGVGRGEVTLLRVGARGRVEVSSDTSVGREGKGGGLRQHDKETGGFVSCG